MWLRRTRPRPAEGIWTRFVPDLLWMCPQFVLEALTPELRADRFWLHYLSRLYTTLQLPLAHWSDFTARNSSPLTATSSSVPVACSYYHTGSWRGAADNRQALSWWTWCWGDFTVEKPDLFFLKSQRRIEQNHLLICQMSLSEVTQHRETSPDASVQCDA